MLKVIHVAACVLVLRVQLFSVLRLIHFDQLSGILDHKLAFLEAPRSHHSPALPFEVVNLSNKVTAISEVFILPTN